MTENNLTIREPIYEEEITEEFANQRVILDLNLYNKINKQDFTLGKKNYFKEPMINKFKRPKSEILVISKKEQSIDIKDVQGETVLPLVNNKIIHDEIRQLDNKVTYRYVQLAATEIIVKACFAKGIDTPLELMLVDERIVEPAEKAIVTKLIGNLIYQKVSFIVKPDYSISLADKNIDKSYVLYYKLSGIKMLPNSRVLSIKCKNAYIISTNHEVKTKSELQLITIDKNYESILKPIDKRLITYNEPEADELEIARKRLKRLTLGSSSMRLDEKQLKNNQLVSSKDKEIRINKTTIWQYHILGQLENKNVGILLDTGSAINLISLEYVKNQRLQSSNLEYIGIGESTNKSLGKIYQIIKIASQEIGIEFEVFNDKSNKIILGTNWLDQVQPWKLGNDKFTFTYKNVKFETDRLQNNYWEI